MSTQLIIYPQYYQGFSGINITTNEFIVDGSLFTHIDSSVTYSTSGTIDDHLFTIAPGLINVWYRWRSTATGTPAFPVTSGTNLILNAVAPSSISGVYMKLANLIIGASYTLTVNMTPQAGWLNLKAFNLDINSVIVGQFVTSNASQQTMTFIAETTTDTVAVLYYNTSATDLTISSISVSPTGQSPTQVYTDLQDGQVICDLYKEEDIPLTLSIDDFKNVAEKVQSYSKNFSLPATKRNNRIFNNMFDVTRSDDGIIFNPYVKTKCVLKQDGFILFEGYLRLIDIKDKKGEISYNVNLYSEVIALADILKDQTFQDLDFSELQHDYNIGNILYSWNNTGTSIAYTYPNTSGFRDAYTTLRYPFIDWNHQFSADPTTGFPNLPNLETAFRPCIQLKYLINKIFAAANFTWTSDFFDTADFEELYMDFNWGGDDTPNNIAEVGNGYFYGTSPERKAVSSGYIPVSFPGGATWSYPFGHDDSSGGDIFTCPAGQTNSVYGFNYSVTFRCYSQSALTADLNVRWLYTPFGGTAVPINPTATITLNSSAAALVVVAPGLTHEIDSVNLQPGMGGYYTSAPSVTFFSSSGSGATATALCAVLPGPVTSITLGLPGAGYNLFAPPLVVFNANYLATYSGTFYQVMNPGDTLQLQFTASANDSIKQDPIYYGTANHVTLNPTGFLTGMVGMTGVTSGTILNTLRGELGQWDFLKGIMTMFNLVTMVDESNPDNILIEPYSDVFINNTNTGNTGNLTLAGRGIQHDWTDKVDVSQMDLKPLTDLNKNTIFKFVEDEDDYVFKQYKHSTSGHLYGSKEYDASGFTVLQGTKEITAEPFAATVSKPLMPQFPDLIVPSLYAVNDEGVCEGFDNSPRIFYNNYEKTLTSCSPHVPAQNGSADYYLTSFLQFSHLSSITPSGSASLANDFVFESNQLFQPIGQPPTDNLYNTYWSPYFNELYSPDTRIMKLKVNLSPADVASFKFYDTVFIKNRVFRVNKIEYKPNTLAKVEFILIP
jgi:hypothetical protein